MNAIKSAMLKRRRWKFDWRKPPARDQALALCHKDQRRIQINPNLDDETMMAALVDEMCHAHFPDLDNDAVDAFSDDVARVLTLIGFRSED